MSWRYLAQNLVTGEWLHTDLPLRDVEIEEAVSAPGGIDASIAPELLDLLDDTGTPVLQEWSTAIYAENGRKIRGAGIFVRAAVEDDGQTWSIECPGFSTYPHGNSYEGDLATWSPDPFGVVRNIWNHLQSFPDGDIGMVVSDALSGRTVGDTKPPPRPTGAAVALKAPTKGPKPVQEAGETDVDYLARVEAWEQDYADRRAVYVAARDAANTAKAELEAAQAKWDELYQEREPYRLGWWEAVDCGDEIDRLATETPFDYMERHEWDADRQNVLHFLDLAHPMMGRRRQDLRFVVGENVAVIPETERDGDEYANTVTALGKGEGRKMLRSTVGQRDGRLRRSAVVSYKDVGNKSRLRALANSELLTRLLVGEIAEIVVWDHPNAPLGSWRTGDEVFLAAPRVGMVREASWVRVVSTIIKPDQDDRVTLRVVNSERIQ